MRTSRGSFPGKRHLLVAGVLGAFAASIPAIANSETTPVEAVNEGGGIYGETHRWSNASQTVLAGATITFRNSTEVPHGVEWRSSLKPTCSSGVPVGSTPTASATKWSGTCTFSQAGTYTFWCTVHGAEMSGTVTVNPNGTTTVETSPPPTVPSTPTTTTTTTPSSTPSVESPLAGPPSQAVKLAHAQHGGSVRGTIDVSKAGAGSRLEVKLFARRASLAKAGHSAPVLVGSLTRRSLPSGRLSFAVKLNARARHTLSRHRRLALTVKIVLTAPGGKLVTVVRGVVQHG